MKDTIIKHKNAALEAESEYSAAFDKAKTIKADRAKKIQTAVRDQQAELKTLKEQRKKANDERGEAIIEGDKATEEELDAAIVEIDRKIAETEQKIEAIGNRSVSQIEKDAVRLALSEYREFLRVCSEEGAAIARIKKKVEEQIESLTSILKTATAQIEDLSARKGNKFKQSELIKLFEETFGPLDVSGHTCGTDEEAKRRFIYGSIKGIEKTAAAALLSDEE